MLNTWWLSTMNGNQQIYIINKSFQSWRLCTEDCSERNCVPVGRIVRILFISFISSHKQTYYYYNALIHNKRRLSGENLALQATSLALLGCFSTYSQSIRATWNMLHWFEEIMFTWSCEMDAGSDRSIIKTFVIRFIWLGDGTLQEELNTKIYLSRKRYINIERQKICSH